MRRSVRGSWLLAVAGLLAIVDALLPWYEPGGRLDDKTAVAGRTLAGWDLVGVGVAASLLAGVLAIAATVVGFGRPVQTALKRRLSWAAFAAALVGAAGVYGDWRYVPTELGIGRDTWDSASINGYGVTTGAQFGVWLLLAGLALVVLAAAWQLRIVVRVLALGYLFALVAVPVVTVGRRAFESGAGRVWDVITKDEDFLAAARLTFEVAGIAVVLNTIFGIGIALLLVRKSFRGQRLLSTFVDLPLAISPVVVGIALILVYGDHGWFGDALKDAGIQIIFSTPGMVLATVIVALPLIVREVVPVLQEAGIEQEQAAASLGANAWQRFARITLPTIKWALAYGVVLCLARSIGEFGAVRVVSQSVSGESQTLTLFVNREYEQLGQVHKDNAFIGSFVLMVVAVIFIVVIAVLKPKEKQ